MKQITRWGRLLISLATWVSLAATADVDHSVSRSVVQIRGVDAAGRMFYGSGVAVAPETVATNCHVMRTAQRAAIYRSGEVFPVDSQRGDIQRDLCLLHAAGITAPLATVGNANRLKTGNTLYFYGFPRALSMSFSEGKVKAVHTYEGSRIIETTAFFTLGGSGGGLFDRSGRLVGLATFLAPGHSGAYYAIPANWIAPLQSQKSQAIAPLQGLSFWEQPLTLPTFLKRPGHR
jgi:S1-C subfamily serine protease